MKRNLNIIDYNKSGVYKITNLINNKFYIGSTKCFSKRYRSHKYTLLKGISPNTILQSSIKKNGIDSFEFSILEVCKDYKKREIYYLELLKPKYNIIKETLNGRELSTISVNKMSISRKGVKKINPKKGYTFERMIKRKVKSINIKTKEEIIFNSIKDAANHFNFKEHSIYNCCLKDRESNYGIKFEYII